MSFFFKNYDQSNSVADELPVPGFINFAKKVYLIIFLSAIFGAAGALHHHLYDSGGQATAVSTILFIYWLAYLDRSRQITLCVCLVACAMFLGATVGPIMNFFAEIDQRSIVFFFGGYALEVCFHLFAICSRSMRVISTINLINLPLFMSSFVFAHVIISDGTFFNIHIALNIQTVIPFVVSIPMLWYFGYRIFKNKTWICGTGIPLHILWLIVLAFSFHYNILHLMCIYMFVMFGVHNLNLHTLDCYYSVNDIDNADRIFNIILTFYTEHFGRSTSILFFSGRTLCEHIWTKNHVVFNNIWNNVCTFCVNQWETGQIVYQNALEGGRALFYKVKVHIQKFLMVVGLLSVLMFLFLGRAIS